MSENEAQDLFALMHRVMKLNYGVAQKCLEKQGMHRAQPGIIIELSKRDGQTQVELANKMGVTPATISAMIKRMERDELLIRKRSDEDQRVTHIYLTQKGREQSVKVKEAFDQIHQVCFKGFSNEDLEQTEAIFNKMIKNFKEISG